jgi:Ca2+-binding EF-hand superfamily protein
VLVKHLNANQLQTLKAEFEKIDTDMSGFLEFKELEQAIQNANFKMSSKEIHDIVKEIDYMDNQKINYSEFLAATINTAEFLTDQKLLAIFKTFDFDNTGEITTQNLKDAFSKFGKEISDQEVKIIMQQHDADGGKTISLDEFKAMMLGH